MGTQSLSFFNRLFPKKIVKYLLNIVDNTLEKNAELDDFERNSLLEYKNDLMNPKKQYLKSNLDFVKTVSPIVTSGQSNPDIRFLYSEILKINPGLISKRLGNELILKNVFK